MAPKSMPLQQPSMESLMSTSSHADEDDERRENGEDFNASSDGTRRRHPQSTMAQPSSDDEVDIITDDSDDEDDDNSIDVAESDSDVVVRARSEPLLPSRSLQQQQRLEQQEKSKPSSITGALPTRRSVSFAVMSECYETLALDDYTPKEITACWYDRDEYQAIKDRDAKTIRRIQKGLPPRDGECFRGLEGSTKEGKRVFNRNVSQAIDAVLDEQDAQWQDEEMNLVGHPMEDTKSHRVAATQDVHSVASIPAQISTANLPQTAPLAQSGHESFGSAISALNNYDNEELLSTLYSGASQMCKMVALTVGLRDEREARGEDVPIYYSEPFRRNKNNTAVAKEKEPEPPVLLSPVPVQNLSHASSQSALPQSDTHLIPLSPSLSSATADESSSRSLSSPTTLPKRSEKLARADPPGKLERIPSDSDLTINRGLPPRAAPITEEMDLKESDNDQQDVTYIRKSKGEASSLSLMERNHDSLKSVESTESSVGSSSTRSSRSSRSSRGGSESRTRKSSSGSSSSRKSSSRKRRDKENEESRSSLRSKDIEEPRKSSSRRSSSSSSRRKKSSSSGSGEGSSSSSRRRSSTSGSKSSSRSKSSKVSSSSDVPGRTAPLAVE